MTTIEAASVWKKLSGIVCLHKKSLFSVYLAQNTFRTKMMKELNEMKGRKQRQFVNITGDTRQPLNVEIRPSYADHPLVLGPRYQTQDLKIISKPLGHKISGVMVFGIGRYSWKALCLHESNSISTYRVRGQFGLKTDTSFIDGKTLCTCRYEYLLKHNIDRAVDSVNAIEQKKMFQSTGFHLQSQEAYDAAAGGLIRPTSSEVPFTYNIKCVGVNLPYFDLELVCVNETEEYILSLVEEIAFRLKNIATTVSINRIRYSLFSIENALLQKHWTIEHVLNNISLCSQILDKSKEFSLFLRQREEEELKITHQESSGQLIDENEKIDIDS